MQLFTREMGRHMVGFCFYYPAQYFYYLAQIFQPIPLVCEMWLENWGIRHYFPSVLQMRDVLRLHVASMSGHVSHETPYKPQRLHQSNGIRFQYLQQLWHH